MQASSGVWKTFIYFWRTHFTKTDIVFSHFTISSNRAIFYCKEGQKTQNNATKSS